MTIYPNDALEWEVLLESPCLLLGKGFIDSAGADALLSNLDQQLAWQRPSLKLYGRTHSIPRQQVWMGDDGIHYRYSGQTFMAEPWHPTVFSLARRIEACLATQNWTSRFQHSLSVENKDYKSLAFNSVLINRYEDGSERMGWHRDNEPELGPNPIIAAINLGAERPLRFRWHDNRWRDSSAASFNIELPHGSLLIMGAGVQNQLEHALLPRKSFGLRINLTFRHVFLSQ